MAILSPEQFAEHISFRKKRFPSLSYKLQANGNHYGLDVTASRQETSVNEREMSIFLPFADGNRRDGVGDLLEVQGIVTTRHRRNPIALFDHGKEISLPIGLTETRDSNLYTVQIDPAHQTAGALVYFYQGTGLKGVSRQDEYDHALFCSQLFDLWAQRLIRSGSIGYQVIQAKQLPADYQRGTPQGLHLLQVLMLECSAVVLPANQDTAQKVLCLNGVCGKPMHPILVKSFQPFAGKRKAQLGYTRKDQGQPCIQGEAAARTGCIPADGEAGSKPESGQQPKKEDPQDLRSDPIQWDSNKYNHSLPDQARPAIDKTEAKALSYYTQDDYYPRLNSKLRTGQELKGSLAKIHDNLQRAFSRVEEFDEPVTVYRGLDIPKDNLKEFLDKVMTSKDQGKGIQMGGYLSTTTNKDTAEDDFNGNILLEMGARKGIDLRQLTDNEGEDELLMDVDSTFVVDEVTEKGGNYVIRMSQVIQPSGEKSFYEIETKGIENNVDGNRIEKRFVDRDHSHITLVDLQSATKDFLPGGVADNADPMDFDTEKLGEGIRHEREHTHDSRIAQEIAMDHLTEDPDYYKRLKAIRLRYKKKSLQKEEKFGQTPRPASVSDFQVGDKVVARSRIMTPKGETFARTGDRMNIVGQDGALWVVENKVGQRTNLSSAYIRKGKAMSVNKDLRNKYRKDAKGFRRRLKKSTAGASVVYVHSKDLEKVKEEAEKKGLKYKRIGQTPGGLEKVKLIGMDDSIDELAKAFGRPLRGVKFMASKDNKELRRKVKAAPEDLPELPDVEEEETGDVDLPDIENPEDKNMSEKWGAQVLRRLHADHSALLGEYDQMLGPLENEIVRGHMEKVMEGLAGGLDEIESLWDKTYPDYDGLEGMKDMEEEDTETEEVDDIEDGLPDVDELEEEETEEVDTDKDMDTIDDTGVPASSEEEDLPDPDEAYEGLDAKALIRRGQKARIKYSKKTIKPTHGKKTKTKDLPEETEEEEVPEPGEVRTTNSDLNDQEKGYVKEAAGFLGEVSQPDSIFGEEHRMNAFHYHKTLGGIAQVEAVNDELNEGEKAAPGTPEWEQEEAAEPEHKSSHRKMCGEASKFFKELSGTRDFGDPHREKAMHWQKQLEGASGGEEPVEEETDDEPPGVVMEEEEGFEPGEMDEKSMELFLQEIERQQQELEELTKQMDAFALN